MNIKKKYRLNSREIRYIIYTKNKKFIRGNILNINLIDQYKNNMYNKFGFSISSKFSKKAVIRNKVRRVFFDIIYNNNYINKKINGKYAKIYVSFRKGFVFLESDLFFSNLRGLLETDLKKIFKI